MGKRFFNWLENAANCFVEDLNKQGVVKK